MQQFSLPSRVKAMAIAPSFETEFDLN
jgi:hypothetical protein